MDVVSELSAGKSVFAGGHLDLGIMPGCRAPPGRWHTMAVGSYVGRSGPATGISLPFFRQ